MSDDSTYWAQRYQDEKTGWDIGAPSRPLKEYIDQLENKEMRILIPGAGNAYEAEYLHRLGFTQVHVLDIATQPLMSLAQRVADFPQEHLIQSDFFDFEGQYDLILEQTFFCSFLPTDALRDAYARQMHSLIVSKGRLAGVWFDIPLVTDTDKRPFGGSRADYLRHLSPYFTPRTFEPCHNSIPPRAGKELFGIFEGRVEAVHSPN